MASKGMIQVSGATYRIVSGADRHYVVRVLDDAVLGSFRHDPVLEVVESTIGDACLLDLARAALRQGRLEWTPAGPFGRDRFLAWTRCLSVLWHPESPSLAPSAVALSSSKAC